MIIAFDNNGLSKPTLEVIDNGRDQVLVRFLPFGDEHMTLHRDTDGSIINTHHTQNKPASVWDDEKEHIARLLRYQNPVRHRGYIKHQPIVRLEGMNGYALIGRRIDLNSFTPRRRYFNNIDLTVPVPSDKFMLNFILSTVDNPSEPTLPRFPTTLGDLCFSFEK